MSDAERENTRPGPAGPTLEKPSEGGGPPAGGGAGMEQSSSAARYRPDPEADGRAGRFWSVRRVPAAVVGLLLLAATGLLLYDIAAVRADRPGAAWRRVLADELATRSLDDPWVVAAAVAAVLLGLWLLVLALTPGLRGLLPMRREKPDLRAGLERRAVAVILRDRALEVSGVQSARVAVSRRRIRVRAQAHFRDLDDVRADLDAVLADGIGELGLARRPALAVHVRRPARG
ncbi:DUF6286 domain-containing protein [Streptomyces sodiiphilus]|uniref:DUF6286 domain-containing protein n=1 Tax=Streptomyces sodiiphilus TaxID=226217 RepID=A0ABP5AMV9_9ACTN